MALSWFKKAPQASAPFAFFSYGMTKCGTTLAFQITRHAMLEAGWPQPLVGFSEGPERKMNFAPDLTPKRAEELRGKLDETGTPLVIKTHGRPTAQAVDWVTSGEGRGHAIFRDPRDMALSMLDHAARNRARGRPAFTEIETLEDAARAIANQLGSLSAWLQLPGIRPLQYEHFAFAPEAGARAVLGQLDIAGNPARIARRVLREGKTLRNKAVPARYKQEMSAANSEAFLTRFAPFYDILYDKPDIRLPLPAGTGLTAKLDNPPPLA